MLNKVLNIDNFVNYREEYSSIIKKSKISGNRLIGLCPFHNDSNHYRKGGLQGDFEKIQ